MDRCLETIGSLAKQLDQPTLNWAHSYMCALRAQIAGNIEEAEQLATEALQIGTDSGQPDVAIFFGSQLAAVSFRRGTVGEMVPLFEQMAADTTEIAGAIAVGAGCWPMSKPAESMTRVASSRSSRPPTSLFRSTPVGSPGWPAMPKPRSHAGTRTMPGSCSTGSRRGPIRWEPPAQRLTVRSATSSAASPPSSTVTTKQKPGSLARPRSTTEPNAEFFAARTNLSWGEMLAERRAPGDTQRARDLLTKAHTSAAAHGYANIERHAAAALQHLD